MEELLLAIQEKLRALPGAESGVQVVDLILEDGRIVPEVSVIDCTYVETPASFEPELVADARLSAQPPRTGRALIFLGLLLFFIFVMFYLLRGLVPQ